MCFSCFGPFGVCGMTEMTQELKPSQQRSLSHGCRCVQASSIPTPDAATTPTQNPSLAHTTTITITRSEEKRNGKWKEGSEKGGKFLAKIF